jgi:hypothetical protein
MKVSNPKMKRCIVSLLDDFILSILPYERITTG